MARAPARHAGGQRFKSSTAHYPKALIFKGLQEIILKSFIQFQTQVIINDSIGYGSGRDDKLNHISSGLH
jgi:hypothetical protein